jgi:hypothetical protein
MLSEVSKDTTVNSILKHICSNYFFDRNARSGNTYSNGSEKEEIDKEANGVNTIINLNSTKNIIARQGINLLLQNAVKEAIKDVEDALRLRPYYSEAHELYELIRPVAESMNATMKYTKKEIEKKQDITNSD